MNFKKLKVVKSFVIFSVFILGISFSMLGQNNAKNFKKLQKSAEKTGFIIYSPTYNDSSKFKSALNDTAGSFEGENLKLYPKWAFSRIKDFVEKNVDSLPKTDSLNNYFMIFFPKKEYLILNFTQTTFRARKKNSDQFILTFESKNTILNNALWREFMSGRPGRYVFEHSITIESNEKALQKFNKQWLNFTSTD